MAAAGRAGRQHLAIDFVDRLKLCGLAQLLEPASDAPDISETGLEVGFAQLPEPPHPPPPQSDRKADQSDDHPAHRSGAEANVVTDHVNPAQLEHGNDSR